VQIVIEFEQLRKVVIGGGIMSIKPWTDKNWLYTRYIGKRMTIDQIAQECADMGIKVTAMTIYNNLIKFNIPIRGGNRKLGPRSVGKSSGKRGGFYG
jgi:hypothetical protein